MGVMSHIRALEIIRNQRQDIRRLTLKVIYLERRLKYMKEHSNNPNIQFDNLSWRGKIKGGKDGKN